MAKYGNQKTVIDGITFDSKKEAKRYGELKLLRIAGQIKALELQPKFSISVNGRHIANYFADFSYFENGKQVVEDVKGGNATKTPLYRIKKKLVEAIYEIEIQEV